MGNSTLNSARKLLNRTQYDTSSRINEKVNKVVTALVKMGVSENYVRGVLERISNFDNEQALDEAIDREMYKVQQLLIIEGGDVEDAMGKSDEDAEGKGSKFAKPVKTKGDAKKTLDDKAKNKGPKLEHLEALFSGEELTPAFKRKAAAIFEAAVNARVEEIQAELVRQSTDVFVEEVSKAKGQMANKLDDYMNYVVTEWMSENELAIDCGLQNEISESFMDGLRDLFENHYISVPKSKVNLVETLTNKVEKLTGKLNNSLHENIQLSKKSTYSNCANIFESACRGLADTEVEKFKSLARGIEYGSEQEYANKLAIIKESYFNSQARGVRPTVLTEEYDTARNPVVENLSPRMDAYFNTIGVHADSQENNTQV